MIPKDFQEVTANRITALFRDGNNRVLLADEVGLGKTIVAKAVVEKTGVWRQEIGDDEYVVVYICSNAAIAEQNCGKLGIPGENRISISEGRLSMQHLTLAEAKTKGNVKLIPMTPATSFQMRNGVGVVYERALAYNLMEKCGICESYKEELSLFMRTSYITKKENWDGYVDYEAERINRLEDKEAYLSNMKKLIADTFPEDLITDIEEVCKLIENNYDKVKETAYIDEIVPWQKQKDIINRIRYCFAQISLGMLNPDLVIMDEFQRFKDLIEIDEDDNSDEAMLSRKFLKDNTDSCVLLLSATPYKPYSTLTEVVDGEETHIKEFMRVMDFLSKDKEENRKFHDVWNSYTEHLSEIRGNDLSVLIASKNDAESALYNHMCRTERRSTGIIDTSKAATIPVSKLTADNIRSYVELQHIMEEFGIGNFPIDYVKSAPFLMSFMNYKVKEKIDKEMSSLDPDERAKCIKKISSAFLKEEQIEEYQKLPDENARLKVFFDEVFGQEDGKTPAELLLWIPPSNKYYKCGQENIFEKCEGYSKTLVFSSWEIVPRVIATLTSYEAERRVNEKISNKSKEEKSYYAVPEDDEMEDDDSSKKNKTGKTRFLTEEQKELVAYPSIWLAGLYDWEEYYGQEISEIRKEIKKEIKKQIDEIASKHDLSKGDMGASKLIDFLDFMDKVILEKETEPGLEKLPSDSELDVLVNMAIGSSAVCLYRTVGDIEDKKDRVSKCCKKSFVRMFNRSGTRSIMDAVFKGTEGKSDENHYEQVFSYCVDGNFQSMLDEYKFALGVDGEKFLKAIEESSLQTSNLPYIPQEGYIDSIDKDTKYKAPRLRVHFAAGYFDAKVSDKAIQRVNNVRNAFNSPFRPFALATTSIGQEGLDFHLYCRKVVHWNLPSNPVDLEQREGRINRYMCHAIRQNVAAVEDVPEWEEKFSQTKEKYGKDSSEMIPYWCLPDDYPFKYKIERIVPMYPFSRDQIKYDRLKNVLALYRLTLGQPRQEEMISVLQREKLTDEQKEELFFDLSPYSRNKKEKCK